MEENFTVDLDIEEISDFINSDKFAHFLTNNCKSLSTALWVLTELQKAQQRLVEEYIVRNE